MSTLQRKTLTPEEIEELSKDLTHQVSVHDNLRAIKTIKNPELRREIEKILTAPKLPDMVVGAGLGTVLGGASGALLVGLGKGLSSAHYGLANAIPGAISGAIIGGQYGRQRRIQDLLQRKGGAMQKKGMLKSGMSEKFRIKAVLDPGFATLAKELIEDLKAGKLKPPERQGGQHFVMHPTVRAAISDFENAMDAPGGKTVRSPGKPTKIGRPLTLDEHRILARELGEAYGPNPWTVPSAQNYIPPRKAAVSRKADAPRKAAVPRGAVGRAVPEPLRKHLGNVLKSTPIKVLGALAALSALGYGTAKALESKTILDKRD